MGQSEEELRADSRPSVACDAHEDGLQGQTVKERATVCDRVIVWGAVKDSPGQTAGPAQHAMRVGTD